MLAKAIPKIPILKENMNFWINNLPRVKTFSTAAQREALASNMVEHEIFGFQSAMLVLQFLLFGSKNKFPSEDVVFKASQFISPEILFSFMLAFFGEKIEGTCFTTAFNRRLFEGWQGMPDVCGRTHRPDAGSLESPRSKYLS